MPAIPSCLSVLGRLRRVVALVVRRLIRTDARNLDGIVMSRLLGGRRCEPRSAVWWVTCAVPRLGSDSEPHMTVLRLLVSLSACLFASLAAAQCESQWLQGETTGTLDGIIHQSTTWDPDGAGPAAPRLIGVGLITGGQVWNASIAAWDGSQWHRLGTPPSSGYGQSVAVWNGNLVAAFDAPGNSCTVASWNGSSWQVMGTFTGDPSVNAAYATLTVHQGNLYAGGYFTQVDGVSMPYVVQWTGSSWAPAGSGPQFPVSAMISFQNVLYVGAREMWVPVGQLATWDGNSWVVVATCNDTIEALAVRNAVSITNTYLYVGGRFSVWTGVSGTVAGPVVRFSPASNTWTGLGFTASTVVHDIDVRSTGLTGFEAVAVGHNGLWQQTTAGWVQIGTAVPYTWCATYYASAWHLMAGSTASAIAQRLQAGVWVPLTPSGSSLGLVRAARAAGSDTIVGGSFGLRQGQAGAWNAVGGLTGQVHEIARMANGDLVVAGFFAAPGLPNGSRIARWNGVTWSSMAYPVIGVNALLPLPDGDLVVGGAFLSIDGANIPYLARWSGGTWQALGGGVNDIVRAMTLLPNGDVVVGGDFTLAGSVINPAMHVARWDGATWTPMSGPSSARSLTTEADGSVVALMDRARRWTNGSWQAVRQTNANAVLALPDGDLCFAGDGAVVRTDAAGVVRASFPCTGQISDFVLAEDGDLIVAGDIEGVADVASVGVARLDAPCAATSTVGGAGCTGSAGPLTLSPIALPWLGSTFRAVATGLPTLAFAVTVTGFAPTGLPLLAVFPTAVPGCTLHVQPDLLDVALPAGGAMSVQFAVPDNPALVGITLHHQVVSLQFDAAFNFTQVAATNSLQSTVGTL